MHIKEVSLLFVSTTMTLFWKKQTHFWEKQTDRSLHERLWDVQVEQASKPVEKKQWEATWASNGGRYKHDEEEPTEEKRLQPLTREVHPLKSSAEHLYIYIYIYIYV